MRLAHFEILERIGHGGMGVVYRARDTHLGRIDAIKVLPPAVSSDPERRSRFLREAQAAANLNHPNIATVYQFGTAKTDDPEIAGPDGPREVLFLAMELVEGEDLQAKLNRSPMEPQKVFSLGVQIADGLAAAHAAGVVHRDLKPNNIRITHDGRVKLLDFGLAKIREGHLSPPSESIAQLGFQTSQGMLLGTPPYMAPEQLKGSEVDERCDLYALGVVLYQMIAGEPPYPTDNLLEYVKALSNTEPKPLSEYSAAVTDDQQAVISKLLAQDPEKRYETAKILAQDLRAVGGLSPSTPVTMRRQGFPSFNAGSRPLRFLPKALATLAAIAASITLIYLIKSPSLTQSSGPLRLALTPFINLTGEQRFDVLAKSALPNLVFELQSSENIELLLPPSEASGKGSPYLDTNTDGVLEGSLILADNRIRFIVSLKETRNHKNLWAQAYEGNLHQLTDRIASMAREIKPVLRTWHYLGSERAFDAADFHSLGVVSLGEPQLSLDPSEATGFFDLAIRKDPQFGPAYAGRSSALLRLAALQRDRSLLGTAEQDALKAIELSPGDPESRIALGVLYRMKGDIETAIKQLSLAKNLDPFSDSARFQLAVAFQVAQKLPESALELREALELRPGYWDYLNQLGIVLRDQGQFEEAREILNESAHNAPLPYKDWPIANLMAVSLSQGRYQEVLEMESRLSDPPVDGWAASNLGTAYFFLDQLPRAETYYRIAVELEPAVPSFHRNLGDVLEKTERLDEAIGEFSEAANYLGEDTAFNPSPEQSARRALYFAKARRCASMKDEVAALPRTIESQLSPMLDLAQAHAVCGDLDIAAGFVLKAKGLGFSLSRARELDELAPLFNDLRASQLLEPSSP